MKNEERMQISLNQIQITDCFFGRYIALVRNTILEYQWKALNDQIEGAAPSHCIDNFRIAAGEKTGEFHGMVFQDTDLAKWIEAAAYSLASHPDSRLKHRVDTMVDLIGRAQEEDGYLNTYFTIKEPGQKFKNLREGHELYTAGHFIEAAVAYYQAVGEKKLLHIMCRYADFLCRVFGDEKGQNHGYSGHPEIELALIKLYDVTQEHKYLELAYHFVNIRGNGTNYFLEEMKRPEYTPIFHELSDYDPAYSQSHMGVREQKTAEGHAVRAVYLYAAMADLAGKYQDEKLFISCQTLWSNIVEKRMFVTGSIGSSGLLERFTTDYDLPNDRNYSESCATIGLAMFGIRMSRLTGDGKYIDTVERALYNTLLSGIAMDGQSFFYVNPLEVWPSNCMPHTSLEHVKPVRQKWFGVACCPPNIARTLASLGQYIYSAGKDTLYINLFVANRMRVELSGDEIEVTVQGKYPVEGSVQIKLNGNLTGKHLAVRIPDYAKQITFRNPEGVITNYRIDRQFAYFDMKDCEQMEIMIAMEPLFIRANPKVRADNGKVCIQRGPVVYAFEGMDNSDNLSADYIDTKKGIIEQWDPTLFGGTMKLKAFGRRRTNQDWQDEQLYSSALPSYEDVELTAIPYAYWQNRGENEMMVWMKEAGNGGIS